MIPASAPAGSPKSWGRSFLSNWEIVLNPPDEPHPDFCHAVSFQDVLDKLGLYSHLDLGNSGERKGDCLATASAKIGGWFPQDKTVSSNVLL